MPDFEKSFLIEGGSDDYVVRFTSDSKRMKASCTCPAGEHFTLCKHVIQCLEDEEVAAELKRHGLDEVFREYLEKDKEAERLKVQAKNIKKKFARLLLR
ncbi:MAG: hypothetical protein IJU55_04815 [Selenomonadaceae bacterium]|nr:hypothetical protein [Selenomonadaceae bacterium]